MYNRRGVQNSWHMVCDSSPTPIINSDEVAGQPATAQVGVSSQLIGGGTFGRVPYFPVGNTSAITCGSVQLLSPTQGSVVVWFFLQAAQPLDHWSLIAGQTASTNAADVMWWLGIHTDGSGLIKTYTDVNYEFGGYGTTNIALNTWYMYSVVYNNGSFSVYLNDDSVAQYTKTMTNSTIAVRSDTTIRVGHDTASSYALTTANVCGLSVWTTALTHAQRTTLYNGGNGPLLDVTTVLPRAPTSVEPTQQLVDTNTQLSDIGFLGTSPKTTCAWVRTSSTSGDGGVWTSGLHGTTGASWGLRLNYGEPILPTRWRFQLWDNDLDFNPPATSDWQHICCVHDGSTAYAYVDGVLSASGSRAINTQDGPLPIRLGVYTDFANTNDGLFMGDILDVRFYARALTANDIVTIVTARGRDNIVQDLRRRYLCEQTLPYTLPVITPNVQQAVGTWAVNSATTTPPTTGSGHRCVVIVAWCENNSADTVPYVSGITLGPSSAHMATKVVQTTASGLRSVVELWYILEEGIVAAETASNFNVNVTWAGTLIASAHATQTYDWILQCQPAWLYTPSTTTDGRTNAGAAVSTANASIAPAVSVAETLQVNHVTPCSSTLTIIAAQAAAIDAVLSINSSSSGFTQRINSQNVADGTIFVADRIGDMSGRFALDAAANANNPRLLALAVAFGSVRGADLFRSDVATTDAPFVRPCRGVTGVSHTELNTL